MTIYPYLGNSPYCYTNTLLMALGRSDLSPALLETLSGSPFGFQLLFGKLPLFDPYGWDPNLGLDQALTLLGYVWQTHSFDDEAQALSALRQEVKAGPVFVGPLDMGLLRHQPESDRASGADHFVSVLEVGSDFVRLHDPQGHPWAALPLPLFMQAWQAEQIGYGQPFTLRTGFQQVRPVDPLDAVKNLLPMSAQWLRGRDLSVPPNTIGGRAGLEKLAQLTEQNFSDELRGMLVHFSIRLGARRKADAAQMLSLIGQQQAADVLQQQAMTLGALQFSALQREEKTLAQGFRTLGQLHEQLIQAIETASA